MGITTEVNLLGEDSTWFIKILIMSYSMPISLGGRYKKEKATLK
ncbi:hypothetical protein LCGC14_1485440 [marine sediment metagenome]|uniref:Uncharacterized protein n=1 Tax=marine sediment metagenome TaxID=412755 RepID=A0A0F9LNV4_9ZZZZ